MFEAKEMIDTIDPKKIKRQTVVIEDGRFSGFGKNFLINQFIMTKLKAKIIKAPIRPWYSKGKLPI